MRGNTDGLPLLEEEHELPDLRPEWRGSSDIRLHEWGGESESEMTIELVRVRPGMETGSQSDPRSEAGELS